VSGLAPAGEHKVEFNEVGNSVEITTATNSRKPSCGAPIVWCTWQKSLSNREREIWPIAAAGKNSSQIGGILRISNTAVSNKSGRFSRR